MGLVAPGKPSIANCLVTLNRGGPDFFGKARWCRNNVTPLHAFLVLLAVDLLWKLKDL